jgi:hypothetical protein
VNRIALFPPRLSNPMTRMAWCACAAVLLAASGSAVALDWSAAKPTDMNLFFPGQRSWEKALTAAEHKGATKIRGGALCTDCHAGEEADTGAEQAKASGFAGRSTLPVQVRVAVEAGALHWQISGPLGGLAPPGVAVMIGSGALKSATQSGCWGACHDDAPGMASDGGQELGKYLSQSRSKNTATGGGTSVKPEPELQAALAANQFLDLAEVAADGASRRGYVLDKLHERDAPGSATVRTEGDRWVAEIQRPLAASGPGELALEPGQEYFFGIAIHDAGVKKNQHLVSLGQRLRIGSGSAEVILGQQTE